MLPDFLASNRAEIIARAKAKVAARVAPRAGEAELTHGIPLFVDQLIDTMRGPAHSRDAINASATRHGNEMLRLGFSVAQVVHDYGDVCQAVTELAFEHDTDITIEELHAFNRCLDEAIAQAVTEHGRLREQALAEQGIERIGALAHELRNCLNTAMLSFAVLREGNVAIGGSTAALLDRSLRALNDLIDRSLAEVRLESAGPSRQPIVLAEFVQEIEIAATIEAKARGHQMTVEQAAYGVVVDADRQHLAAAVTNLLQNAFKFTLDPGQIWLRTRAASDHVYIDIEDQCGGLPPGQAEALFRPFHQGNFDRSGLGLGLSISRKAVQMNGGDILVRDLPGRGCIFTIELPMRHGESA